MAWYNLEDQQNFGDWTELFTEDGLAYYYNNKTGITQWERPAELGAGENDRPGEWVWAPHEDLAYVPAQVIKRKGKKIYLETEQGESITVKSSKKLDPLLWSSLQRVVADLVLLDEMNVPLILHNLKERFEQKKKIYTNIGTICISLNPYIRLPLYTMKVIREYEEGLANYREMPPHVFIVADNAYKGLTMPDGLSQSIIISGESGAGKTEATKQCLKYISAVAGSVGGIESKILQANPILEGFGNAKTVRNNNSSRFGKYCEIQFTKEYEIIGARTNNYLLEKIRVVQQAEEERNFHVFYQLCAGATEEERKELGIKSADTYHLLNQTGCDVVDGIDDAEEWADLKKAFNVLAFKKSDQKSCIQLIAAVLHIGNVKFNAIGKKKCTIKSKKAVEYAAKLMEVDKKALEKALLIRTLKMKGQKDIDVSFSKDEAVDNRNALCKFIYGKMFDWIVVQCNRSMVNKKGAKSNRTIGILDIFGFEIFKVNSFEQLCINFTNEKLQQLFNQTVFKQEEKIYQKERIKFEHVAFTDNQPIVDLLEKKPHGLYRLLDEECKVVNGSDAGFMSKAEKKHKKNANFEKSVKYKKSEFLVIHYAGPVVYDTDGFLEKNFDTLSADLLGMLYQSKKELLVSLFPPTDPNSKKRKETLGHQFTSQLGNLMKALMKTAPHYIRCIKPNPDKAPMEFSPIMCAEQLKYAGVFEAVKIRKLGFPFRLKHNDFCGRYGPMLNIEGSGKEICKKIIKKMKLKDENIQIGLTRVLYRAMEHKSLELRWSVWMEKKTLTIRLEEMMAKDPEKMEFEDREHFFRSFAKACKRCRMLNISGKIVTKALKKLEIFVEMRMDPETEELLNRALETKDEADLEAAMEAADMNEYDSKLVKKVRKLRDKVVDINARLQSGIEQRDENMLYDALQDADEIGLVNSWTDEGGELYDRIIEIHAAEEEATKNLDVEAMDIVIEDAEAIGLNSDQIVNCRLLRNRLYMIYDEIETCDVTLCQEQYEAILHAADEIGFSNDSIEYYRKLKGMGDMSRIKEQLRAAAKAKDEQRSIWLQISMKDQILKMQKAMFAIRNFEKIKTPEYWASEAWFGKEKLRMSFYNWTEAETIHSSLTECGSTPTKKEKVLRKEACSVFPFIKTYMKERQGKETPDVAAAEIIKIGVTEPHLRSEIYCQLVKQTTKCSSGNVQRGWDLMKLCLNAFAPSEDFETFLDVYIRDNAPKPSTALQVLFAKTCYKASKKVALPVPSPSQYQSLIANNDTSGFSEPFPAHKTWEALYTPYAQGTSARRPQGDGRRGSVNKTKQRHVEEQKEPARAKPTPTPAPKKKVSKPKKYVQPEYEVALEDPNIKWYEHEDPDSGDFYYEELATGETTWDVLFSFKLFRNHPTFPNNLYVVFVLSLCSWTTMEMSFKATSGYPHATKVCSDNLIPLPLSITEGRHPIHACKQLLASCCGAEEKIEIPDKPSSILTMSEDEFVKHMGENKNSKQLYAKLQKTISKTMELQNFLQESSNKCSIEKCAHCQKYFADVKGEWLTICLSTLNHLDNFYVTLRSNTTIGELAEIIKSRIGLGVLRLLILTGAKPLAIPVRQENKAAIYKHLANGDYVVVIHDFRGG